MKKKNGIMITYNENETARNDNHVEYYRYKYDHRIRKHPVKLNENDKIRMSELYLNGMPAKIASEKYGVSIGVVYNYVKQCRQKNRICII